MKPRTFPLLGVAALCGLLLGLHALAQDKKADPALEGYRTVETAITTRISPATPEAEPTARVPGYLGVHVEVKAGRIAVVEVEPDSPAAKAGFRAGDILTRVGDREVKAPQRLRELLQGKGQDAKLDVELRRDDEPMRVTVTLGAVSSPLSERSSRGGRGGRGFGRSGWDTRRRGLFRKDTYRLAVVAIEYPDAKHNARITPAEWEKALFSEGAYTDRSVTGQRVYGSLNDYYLEQSCGAMKVEGKVFDHVQVKKDRQDYLRGQRSELLVEALDRLLAREGDDALKDFDGLFFLYAGGRVRTERGGLYWPHRSGVRHKGRYWSYFICPEGGGQMSSISVIAHEFGHMLGLPDLYSREGSEGLGVWCTMATGHGRDGKPRHFSAWCKEQLGWLEPAVIDPRVKQKLILRPVVGSKRECYKVLLRPDGREYLLLENRVKKAFDRDLPAEGLLIWRVADGRPVLEESHGITSASGSRVYPESVPYPSRANNAFTPFTTPSSKPRSGDGLPVHITNIRRLPDGTITFYIGYEYL